jgi:hypothetical protein
VIDVFVGAFEAPDFRVLGEVLFHVLVNQLLEIEVELAEGADDDVGANSAFLRDISIGIFESNVRAIISRGDPDLFEGRVDEPGAVGLRRGFATCEQGDEKEEGSKNSHFETSEVVSGVCLV